MLTDTKGNPIQPKDTSEVKLPGLSLPIGASALGYFLFGIPGSLLGAVTGLVVNAGLGIPTFGSEDDDDDYLFGPDPEEKTVDDVLFGPDSQPEVNGETTMPPWTPDSYGYSSGDGYGTFSSYGTGNPSILNAIPTADGGSTPATLYPDASFGTEGHGEHSAFRSERTDHGSVFGAEFDEKNGEKIKHGKRTKRC